MKDYRLTDWLPTTKKEVELHGWEELDVILFSADAYVDHPSFGAAVIGRVLQAEGLRVAIVPQPNWRDDLRDFRKLGRPRLFFGISAGCMDSMVNKYTANKRLRSDDAYTPDARSDMRPRVPHGGLHADTETPLPRRARRAGGHRGQHEAADALRLLAGPPAPQHLGGQRGRHAGLRHGREARGPAGPPPAATAHCCRHRPAADSLPGAGNGAGRAGRHRAPRPRGLPARQAAAGRELPPHRGGEQQVCRLAACCRRCRGARWWSTRPARRPPPRSWTASTTCPTRACPIPSIAASASPPTR